MLESVYKNCKILKVLDSQAAAQTDPTTDIVDVQNYDGACFICKLGTVTDEAAVTMTVYSDDDSALGDAAALTGASAAIAVADADSEQSLVVEVIKPTERYLRATIVRDTQDSEIDSVFCILFNPRKLPVDQPDTIDAAASVVSPAQV